MHLPNQPAPTFENVVAVIESPSPQDILEGRREGNALVSALE